MNELPKKLIHRNDTKMIIRIQVTTYNEICSATIQENFRNVIYKVKSVQ